LAGYRLRPAEDVSSQRLESARVLKETMDYAYRLKLLSRDNRRGWMRCLVWGALKASLEGVGFLVRKTDLWMRVSLGLVWVGIASGVLVLFLTTRRLLRMPNFSRRLWGLSVLEIVGATLLVAELPLLGFGLFRLDGLVTLASTFMFLIVGYRISVELRNLPPISTCQDGG